MYRLINIKKALTTVLLLFTLLTAVAQTAGTVSACAGVGNQGKGRV